MSKQNQEFDDLFKMAFDDHQVTPPTHLWDNIERELPPASDDLVFKQAFSNFEVEPSPVVWENVSRKLPFSLVIRRHLTMLSRVAAVVLMVMLATLFFDEWNIISTPDGADASIPTAEVNTQKDDVQNTTPDVVSELVTNEMIPEQTAEMTTIVPEKSVTKRRVIFIPETNILSSDGKSVFKGRDALNKQTENAIKGEEKDKLKSKATQPFAQINTTDLIKGLNYLDNSMLNGSNPTSDRVLVSNALSGFMERLSLERRAQEELTARKDEIFRKEAMSYEGLYVSAATQWSNSWIINQAINDELGAAVAPAIDYGKSFGVSAGYKFSPKASIELGVNHSQQGQRYREIANGERITSVDLTYLQIPLTFKYRRKELSNQTPVSISYIGGLQYSRAIQSPQLAATLNGEKIADPVVTSDLFVTNEIGVVGGLDWDFYLNKNWSITAGVRGSVGTDMSQPFADGSSYNALFGAKAGINYRFAN
ncbi:MAG: outer membrane beta-barrel protein [Saprospiraceae bacterium]